MGARLTTLDISDPARIRELGVSEVLAGTANDVFLSGDSVYVAAGEGGLVVLDVKDAARPRTTAHFAAPGYAEGVFVAGRYAYLADGGEGVRVIDVNDHADPREVASIFGDRYVFGAVVVDGYVYAAAAGAGLVVADVSDPIHPREVAHLPLPGYAYGIAVSGKTAYVADGWRGVRVIDVSQPARPVELATLDADGWALGLATSGPRLFAAEGIGGLAVFDVHDPVHPVLIGTAPVSLGDAERVALAGDRAYVADRDVGVHVIDISSADTPHEVGRYGPITVAEALDAVGARVLVTSGEAVHAVDTSDPVHPRDIGRATMGGRAMTVAADGDAAFVTTFGNTTVSRFRGDMYVLDVSGGAPVVTSRFTSTGRELYSTPRHQLLAGSVLYVAAEESLDIFDVSSPRSPCVLATASMTDGRIPDESRGDPEAHGIDVVGGFAYIAAAQGGLLVMDVTDPRKPSPVGRYLEPANGAQRFVAEDVRVRGTTAFLFGSERIVSVDVSTATQPRRLGAVEVPAAIQDRHGHLLAIDGSTLYLADGAAGLVVVDVSDPASPRVVRRHRLGGQASAVATDGRYVYVAAGQGGLVVLGGHVGSSRASGGPAAALTPPIAAAPFTLAPASANAIASLPAPALLGAGNSCVVSTPNDAGPGSLRDCLGHAGAGDTVTFDPSVFPPQAPATIKVLSALPIIKADSVTVDASNAGVILDGSSATNNANGLEIAGSKVAIKGLQVLRFPGNGILLGGSSNTLGGDPHAGASRTGEGNVVSGNRQHGVLVRGTGHERIVGNIIGLDASGTKAFGNNELGVLVNSAGNVIGGPTASERNVVSGNVYADVGIACGNGNRCANLVQGNYIGTDVTGGIGISDTGYNTVFIEGGSARNRIEANVIAGRLSIADPGSTFNEVVGNKIGTDVTGTQNIGRLTSVLIGQPHNRLGGPSDAERNVISGSVTVTQDATDVVVAGNYIGVDASGSHPLRVGALRLDATHSFIGGMSPEEGNVLGGGPGFEIVAGADDNLVANNAIGTDRAFSARFPNNGLMLTTATHDTLVGNLVAGAIVLTDSDQNVVRGNRTGVGVQVRSGDGNVLMGNVGP